MPELGIPAGPDRVRHGHRLRGPVRVLHGHLRDARDPRPRPGARDRGGHLPAGPLGLGGERRRGRPLDRRDRPDPRPAPQRAAEDPALQQPDLRAHEGPVLADPARRARSRSPRPSARRITPSTRWRSRSAPRPRSWRAAWTPTKSTWPRPCAPRRPHQGAAIVEIYQNCNVFNDGAFDAVRAKGQRELNQNRLEHGKPIRFGPEGERGVARGSGRPASSWWTWRPPGRTRSCA